MDSPRPRRSSSTQSTLPYGCFVGGSVGRARHGPTLHAGIQRPWQQEQNREDHATRAPGCRVGAHDCRKARFKHRDSYKWRCKVDADPARDFIRRKRLIIRALAHPSFGHDDRWARSVAPATKRADRLPTTSNAASPNLGPSRPSHELRSPHAPCLGPGDGCDPGARSLLRAPGLAVAGTFTLALGIGAATALFSVVNAVLVRPLPYDRPDTRVMIWSRWTGFDKTWVSEHEVFDYRRLPAFRQVAAWATGQANLTGDGDPVRVGIAPVTVNAFSTLGAEPILGRHFRPEKEKPGADAVVIVSYRLWHGRYGGDPGLVGRTILIDGRPRQVVGVMPRGFRLPTDFGEDAAEPTELWVPLFLDPAEERGNHGLYAAAELAPGTTATQATAQLEAMTRSLTEEGLYPEAMRFSAFAVPLPDEIAGGVRPALLLLSGAVVFLLLIACANVAHLLLARAEVRRREIAVRTSLGADRRRLLLQLLAESLVLAVPSGLFGVVLAALGVRLFFASGLAGIPRAEDVGMDWRVLLFAMAVALGTTLVLGSPLRASTWASIPRTPSGTGRGAAAGQGRSRLRSVLVVAETALSVVLLVGAGLLLQSLWALQRVELGFVPDHVLTGRVSLPGGLRGGGRSWPSTSSSWSCGPCPA